MIVYKDECNWLEAADCELSCNAMQRFAYAIHRIGVPLSKVTSSRNHAVDVITKHTVHLHLRSRSAIPVKCV